MAESAPEADASFEHQPYNDGIHVLVHMRNLVDAEVVFNPPLENVESMFLEAHFVRNCSNPVVRMIVDPQGQANLNHSIIAYAIYDYTANANVTNPDTGVAFRQGFGSAGGDITINYPSFSRGNPLILYTGETANQGGWFQYEHPPLVSKDFASGKLEKLRITLDTIFSNGTGVTLDRLLLSFRIFLKKKKFYNAFRPVPGDRRTRPTSSALSGGIF
jgi:hypothetical protein